MRAISGKTIIKKEPRHHSYRAHELQSLQTELREEDAMKSDMSEGKKTVTIAHQP